ncbi:ABC transporter ATP-binding protein [Eubacterium sp. MSJ-13]|uniref:ABC transporter ATP-binding protein n=1 Tax=Eubacterium sp. MSJ-13 TaxID=2841513 RepID=UPI001C11D835|nr:ABC transporter ATP-binding protein [Eubacterium sp. MSJ-13]MBU5479118.1 ABC transporter ATP-binding protein [Eubacterium sp. MSJ-13]
MSTLKINNLSKKFRANDFYSLEDVNLEINAGDIVGLVGRNGAGKSTLLKLIAKSYIPTSGTVEYNGKNIFNNDYILKNVGIMIEPVFYPYMTVKENLEFYLDVHGKKGFKKNIDNILELVDLVKKKNNKPENFSFGMKQRLSLAIVLVDEPDFLILDEPFVGLDPYGVQELLEILQGWVKERNISMIISSHQLSELESICNRFVMLEHGKMKNIQVEDEQNLGQYFTERKEKK